MGFNEHYFELQKQNEELYGKDTIVLIQKGKFYECYEYEECGKAHILGSLINMTVTLSNKNKHASIQHPYMCGIPTQSIDRNLAIMLENNYTVVIYDQDEDETAKSSKTRSLKAIYSPGTYIDTNNISNNIACVYVEYLRESYFFGLSSVDLATGHTKLFEIHNGNTMMKFEECYRITESINPIEIIVVSNKELPYDLKTIFENNQRKVRFMDYNNQIKKLSFQNDLLTELYNIKSNQSALEYMNINYYQLASYSFVYLLNFCCEYNKSIVYNLNYPIFENFEKRMILHNNSIYQLNIINYTKDKSLFTIIDQTSTALGKRMLYNLLVNPVCDITTLDNMYNDVEKMIPLYEIYEKKLKCVVDIEKLHRKMSIKTIKPHELWNLIESYDALTWIIEHEDDVLYTRFESYNNTVNTLFIQENLKHCKDFDIALFKPGVNSTIDEHFDMLKSIEQKLEEICKDINKYVPKNGNVNLEENSIETTPNRAKTVQKESSNKYTFEIKNKQIAHIKNQSIDSLFHEKSKIINILKPLTEREYYMKIYDLYLQNKDMFMKIHYVVANADVKKSKAKCAVLYNYTRPYLSETQKLEIENMKHPIIEQLNNNVFFDPYNVNFTSEKRGMLLYGVNGSGKSTYSKSIALNVVLAQTGHYVCAGKMTYKPYERLYTRLGDNDNIYKGQSSFFVEINELKSIVHYANEHSLIIGDEPCRGTEDTSALSIVSFTLEWLLENNATFVFATHLHQLTEISCIKNNMNLMIKHVSVEYNAQNMLVYTHVIKEGKCKKNYGLEIAQRVMQLEEFNERTNKIFNEITKHKSPKQSRYNSSVYMKKCEICQNAENLHTHHIHYQHTFNENSPIKDISGNLVTLCEICHLKTHQNKLYIYGWKQTPEGKFLDYKSI